MNDDVAAPLTIRLFGAFHVDCAGRPMPALRSQKGKWLLALLTLQHGREIQRAWLANLLWPDQDRAQDSLNVCLSDLRKKLGDETQRLIVTRRTLRLELDGADVDLFAFEAAMAARDPDALRRAVALYAGPLLEDCSEAWVTQYREKYSYDCVTALETLATRAMADGEREEAIGCLQRAAAAGGPIREKTYVRLMQALADHGDYTDAMQVYVDLKQRLHQDYGRAPEEATAALYQHLRQEAHRRATTPAVSAVANSIPAATPSHIPRPLTALIGRESELQAIVARLLAARLLTLTGPGGVGKTRLAIEAALQMTEDFAHGVHFVALDAIADPDLLAQQVAATLDVEAAGGRTWHEALVNFLRSRQLLIVLDNCEHLIDACADLARALLGTCPGLRMLATSRERLGLTGEQVWNVRPLELPKREGPLELRDCLDSPAIRLFCERAAASRSAFSLSVQNAAEVVEICRRLDGLPLAIELAAALLEALSVHDVTARLEDRFQLLKSADKTAPVRHQALEAALNWSYERLTPAEQALLRRLSVFAGGWTLHAAESLYLKQPGSGSQVLALLMRLASKSLIFVMEDRQETRYGMLESIRAYGLERLNDPAAWRQIRQAHCEYYMAYAETAETKLLGPDQPVWMARLEREHDNLRAALKWATGPNGEPEMALRLGSALMRFWYDRGYLDEGRAWLQTILHAARKQPAALRLKAVRGLGNLCYAQDDGVAARRHFEEFLALAQSLQDRRAQASALASLANVEVDEENFVSARHRFEASLQLFQELEDVRGTALTLSNLAMLACSEREYATARSLHERGLALFRQLGALQNIAQEANNMMHTLLNLGETAAVRPYLEESLELSERLDSPAILAHCLSNARTLAVMTGELRRAATLLGAEAALRERIDFPLPSVAAEENCRDEAAILGGLGEIETEIYRLRGRDMTLEEVRAFARQWSE